MKYQKIPQKMAFENSPPGEKPQEDSAEIFGIPQYGLKAYALFFTKYGLTREFSQKELNWIVSGSMKKKIFALLLKAGWIEKRQKNTYICVNPGRIFQKIFDYRIPGVMKTAEKDYCFTGLSAIEIWSDYSYVQRSWEKSPYFIKVLKKDLKYWKNLFNSRRIPNYLNSGSTIGEYAILIPEDKLEFSERYGLKVEKLKSAVKIAKSNKIYLYAYNYMREKYG